MEEMDPSVFASKMVHEMFHGFQNVRGWGCFPNDVEALMRYENSAEALSIKLRENALLTELLECHDEDKLNELLALRRSRLMRFPYETEYEAMTEEIEGSANYVEWKVLEQLAPETPPSSPNARQPRTPVTMITIRLRASGCMFRSAPTVPGAAERSRKREDTA